MNLLWTIGRQAGQALERARLHEQTARQAARASFLLEAARLLAEAADVAETVELVAGLVVDRLADLCVIDLETDEGLTRPAVRHRDPGLAHLVEELRSRHLPRRSATHPSVRALRGGGTEWIRAVDDDFLRSIAVDEEHLAAMRALDIAGVVAVPLTVEGRQLGVLTVATDRRRGPFTVADVEVAEQLALQLGLVVARAQRFDLAVRTSHALQRNLLPPAPPELEGLSIAVRYLAATRGVDVGGDFYDVVRLPGTRSAWPSATSSATTSPPPPRWASCAASTGRCSPTARRRAPSSSGCRPAGRCWGCGAWRRRCSPPWTPPPAGCGSPRPATRRRC